jgi:hypothetical protein
VLHGTDDRLLTIDNGTPEGAQKASDYWLEKGHTMDGKSTQEELGPGGTGTGGLGPEVRLLHAREPQPFATLHS